MESKGKTVIPKLEEDHKEFMNQFNKEYYGASFKPEDEGKRIHKSMAGNDEIKGIKAQIKRIKAKRKKIFDKSPNTTTESDRDKARLFTEQIEEMEDFLNEVHPKRACEHANNARNRCFLNRNKASNDVDLISWETLHPDDISIDDPETIYNYILDKPYRKDNDD